MDNVKNKTAIVTGGGSGIGYAITEDLLHKGAKKVAIIDLPLERCYNATVTLQEKFGKDRVVFFPTDITNAESYKETFKDIVNVFNGLDILINNAGICKDNNPEQTFAINVVALIRGSMLGLDYMGKHKNGKGGTIVNISSLSGLGPFFLMPVYCSSKHAVIGFSSCLEKFYDKTGVRILTMCPSFTTTLMTSVAQLNESFDILDENLFNNWNHQSATHVGQATVTAIQKGENGSYWIVKNNEPPSPIKLVKHTEWL